MLLEQVAQGFLLRPAVLKTLDRRHSSFFGKLPPTIPINDQAVLRDIDRQGECSVSEPVECVDLESRNAQLVFDVAGMGVELINLTLVSSGNSDPTNSGNS